MLNLAHHRHGKDYYNHDYKKTNNKEKRCTKCSNVERRTSGKSINKAYYCTILNKFIINDHKCKHFKKKPKRANNVINKREYNRVLNAKIADRSRSALLENETELLKNECKCIKSSKIYELIKGKTYYYRYTASKVRSRLIFKLLRSRMSFVSSVSKEVFKEFFE